MSHHDLLFRLYDEFDTETLRAHQEFLDLLPPLDSPLALDYWSTIREERTEMRAAIEAGFPTHGETLAQVASRATRDQAFTALDLYTKHERGLNALVLDVDETLRSAGNTDNEIPRETLYLLTEFYESGVPIVICTGQTLENVKGFLIQGLGNEAVYSGDVSIVYEAGTGVFTPGHGPQTKQLLYDDLDPEITDVFTGVRSRVLPEAPEHLRKGCHLQGNEFNITLKPNFETGSERAHSVIDDALVYLLDLLEVSVASVVEDDTTDPSVGDDSGPQSVSAGYARAFYAEKDPEIEGVLDAQGEHPDTTATAVPESYAEIFDRIDVAYYEADAAEIGSLELNKVVGVQAAFDVLDIDDPFALVMGDSKSDLRVMRWLDETNAGIGAAPVHASEQVLRHVRSTDELVFDQGDAAEMLRIASALNLVAELDDEK
jgi:hydroxymethylpyrimidine pyrophosphatase-like HAD family hydrolase